MGIKTFKAKTPTQRYKSVSDFNEITVTEPFKPLTTGFHRKKGRSSQGRITSRRRGGGHKRLYRIIDFKRDKKDIEGKVITIEYDPNRSARIALVCYRDGEYRYILSPQGLTVGSLIMSSEKAPINVGNTLPLKKIPTGMEIHNIELKKGKGGQIVRAAGSSAMIVSKEGKYCHVKLPSNEIRMISKDCVATIGKVSNVDNENIIMGKAGRKRWLGKRPKVRGVAMNPVDHPHGGGEGKSKGYKQPTSPQGVPAKGYKTRHKRKSSDKFIIKRRK
ncbi:MAG: 50S ribosomal protein L2 [Spirochaetes bacterium]|nr:50S ribosomal protein L2 [Spirochaetota bacterium]